MVATMRLIAYSATLLVSMLDFWEGAVAFVPAGITTTTASSFPRIATNFLFHNGYPAIRVFALGFASNSNNHEGPPELRKLYEMVNGTSTTDKKIFEENLAALKQYKRHFGTANIPESYKHQPGHPLQPISKWVSNMRGRRPRLAKEQREALDKIRFTWNGSDIENRNQRWENMYQRLCDFNATYGHCCVPSNFTQDRELGNWVRAQRTFYKEKRLIPIRIDLLNRLNFTWSLRIRKGTLLNKRWQQRYKQLEKYKKKYNHTNVPRTFDKEDPFYSLGMWVQNQRLLLIEKKLIPERKRMLDELGFLWSFDEVREAEWLRMYNLCKLKHQKGKAPIRDDLPLRSWEQNQREMQSKGRLKKSRKAMLDDIDFRWEINPHSFKSK